MNAPESDALGFAVRRVLGLDGHEAARVAGLGLGLGDAAAAAGWPGCGGGRGGGGCGCLEAGRRFAVEGDVQVVLVGAVGEEALRADLEGRADLGRAQVAGDVGDLAGQLAGGGAAGVDDLAVDARDVDAAPDEVVGDRAAGGELVVAGLDHRQLDLVLLGELVEQRDHPRVDVAAADVLLRVGVEHQVLVVEQRLGRRVTAAPPAPPAAPRTRPGRRGGARAAERRAAARARPSRPARRPRPSPA